MKDSDNDVLNGNGEGAMITTLRVWDMMIVMIVLLLSMSVLLELLVPLSMLLLYLPGGTVVDVSVAVAIGTGDGVDISTAGDWPMHTFNWSAMLIDSTKDDDDDDDVMMIFAKSANTVKWAVKNTAATNTLQLKQLSKY